MAEKKVDEEQSAGPYRAGMVAVVGRPNAGKSTLINTVLGEQLCVVSTMPQTTRRNLKGIYTARGLQIVFVDTPGIHDGSHRYNRAMTNESRSVLRDRGVDLVAYMVDLGRDFGPEEDVVAGLVAGAGVPVVLVFNKVDRCADLPAHLAKFAERYPALAGKKAVCVTATSGESRKAFVEAVRPLLPEGPPLYPGDDLTDENMRFFAAEFLRKGIIYSTQKEVPHASCVEILAYSEGPTRHTVDAVIHVETDGQRIIVIGKGGTVIGKIRTIAESEMRRLARVPVQYRIHVKVTPKWRDKPQFLREMGYRDA